MLNIFQFEGSASIRDVGCTWTPEFCAHRAFTMSDEMYSRSEVQILLPFLIACRRCAASPYGMHTNTVWNATNEKLDKP